MFFLRFDLDFLEHSLALGYEVGMSVIGNRFEVRKLFLVVLAELLHLLLLQVACCLSRFMEGCLQLG